ncbi:MAG: hypothetical protein IKW44_00810, partial [Bacteroidaceae bacterium]|nr:hypothetical protein [Bacteroidaceae bacterium]
MTTPEENVLPIAAHVYDQKVVEGQYRASEATCLQQATYFKSCVCGRFDRQLSETFAAGSLGAHIPGMVVEAKAPVCETETDGNIAYCVCALEDCGKKFTTVEGKVVELSDEDIVVKWAHSWAKIVANDYLKDQATCVKYETYYKSCEVCGVQHDSETFEYGNYRPHTLGEIVPAKQVTCLEDGHVEYSICPVCSQYVDKNAQVIGDGTAAAIVIATPNNGKHDYKALPADNLIYKEATCTSAALYHKTCQNCGIIDEETANEADRYFEYGDKLPHDYFAWVEAVAEQCEVDGNVKYRECKSCHKYFDENDLEITTYVIARTGHKEAQVATEDYLVSPATCTARAIYQTSCEKCGKVLESTFEHGDLAPHALNTHHDAVPASCGTPGSVEYWECDNCHKFFLENGQRVDSVETPALQHGWVSWVMENDENLKLAQSCTNAATYWQYCTRCGEISTELTFTVGQPAPHSFDWEGSFTAANDPTCTAQGNVAYYECEHCHKFFAEDKETELTAEQLVREVVEHNWVEDTEREIMVSPATCQVLAKYEKVCSICGKHASEYTLAGDEYYFSAGEYAEHNKQFHDVVLAQCGQEGAIAHYTCSYECGKFWNENQEEVTSIVIPAL